MRRKLARSRVGVGMLVAAVAMAAPVASPSYAVERGSSPDAIANLVQNAAADVAESRTADDAGFVDEATVDIPRDPDDRVLVGRGDDPVLEVPLPDAVDLTAGVASSDGVMVYAGKGDSPDVTVEALPSGARVSTVIRNDTTDHSFDYPLPDGVRAELQADGRIELTEHVDVDTDSSAAEVSRVIGYVEPAWALDSAGNSVATFYEVRDDVITQRVQTDASTTYPVVADPQWSVTSWNQIRIRWNRAETATIAAGGWGATGAAGTCGLAGAALAGPPGAAVGSAACLAVGGSAVYTAGVAQNSSPRRCLEMYATIVFTVPPAFLPWFGTYSGGSCR